MSTIRINNSKFPPGGIRFRLPPELINFTPPVPPPIPEPENISMSFTDMDFSPVNASAYQFSIALPGSAQSQIILGRFFIGSGRPFITRYDRDLNQEWFSHITWSSLAAAGENIIEDAKTVDGLTVSVGYYRNTSLARIGYVLFTDINGNYVRAVTTPGPTGASAARFFGIDYFSNNDLIVCGQLARGATPTNPATVIRTTLSGNTVWARTFNVSLPFDAVAVDRATDNFYAFGVLSTNIRMVGFNSAGVMQFNRQFAMGQNPTINKAIFFDGFIYLTVSFTSGITLHGGMMLMKIDLNGSIIWYRRLSSGINSFSVYSDISIIADDQIIQGMGSCIIGSNQNAPTVTQYDLDGNLQYVKVFIPTSANTPPGQTLVAFSSSQTYITTRANTPLTYTFINANVSSLSSNQVVGIFTVSAPTSSQLSHFDFTITSTNPIQTDSAITVAFTSAAGLVYTLV